MSPNGGVPPRLSGIAIWKNSPKKSDFNEIKSKGEDNFIVKWTDGSWQKAFTETFTEFCDCTSIHGIKHFLNHSWFERLLWIVLFVISITGCSLMISLVWQKWNQSPVILSFDNKLMTMAAIPFPAVTVCSDAKVDIDQFNYRSAYEKYLRNEKLNETEIEYLLAIDSNFCKNIKDPSNLPLPDKVIDKEFMRDLAIQSNDFISCESGLNSIGGVEHSNCILDIQRISTNEGLCYTFNLLNTNELLNEGVLNDYDNNKNNNMSGWHPYTGYENYIRGVTYPKRSFGAGSTRGINLHLKTRPANYVNQCSNESHHGYNIFLHPPTDYPWKKEYMYKVGMDQQMAIIIKPPSIITSENLKGYPILKRKCYFEDERKLKLFRYYSQANCELECLTSIMFKKCGCVEYWMPHLPHMTECKFNRIIDHPNCSYDDIEIAIQEERVKTIVDIDNQLECNCLPSCNSIQYEADQTMLLNRAEEDSGKNDSIKYVNILLYYKTFQFIPMKRTELYTDLDFISNCGGLLSLFIGTSLLSIVEVLYFFTIRLVDNIKAKKNL
ncbi:pickpocket protein 11-like [Culicoides brevitarsis]|uniref:pickpocket protein 11-like n=1 Tax=Culicoides brevitarsis TaxID=469753 RepID=UPI00307BF279